MENPPPSPWEQLVRSLIPQTEAAFLAEFKHPIRVDMRVRRSPEGRPVPTFHMAMAKTGLLPTAIERTWFEAYVSGYRQCCNIVLDLLAPADGQVPS